MVALAINFRLRGNIIHGSVPTHRFGIANSRTTVCRRILLEFHRSADIFSNVGWLQGHLQDEVTTIGKEFVPFMPLWRWLTAAIGEHRSPDW